MKKYLSLFLWGLILGFFVGFVYADEGVSVGKPSALRNLVSAESLEKRAAMQYEQLKKQVAQQNALAPESSRELAHLRQIAKHLIAQSSRFNPRSTQWQWEVNLIASSQINAFCMPGGKIAVYTGILRSLHLTDDEIAMVMGHEIAHALREHARAQAGKGELTQWGSLGLSVITGGRYDGLVRAGANLLTLKFSRNDETEADLVGMELAARAGYDPRSGISLWKKMSASHRGAPPQWLSTHPSGDNRIREIEKHLPEVMPFYKKAMENKRRQNPNH
ncbi:MAG: M48 family metallopeptidase [Betaproteobacteria bacterium]